MNRGPALPTTTVSQYVYLVLTSYSHEILTPTQLQFCLFRDREEVYEQIGPLLYNGEVFSVLLCFFLIII